MNSDPKKLFLSLQESKMYTHAQYYNVVFYVTGRMRKKKHIYTISYVEHCTVVELEQQLQLLVVVELVD